MATTATATKLKGLTPIPGIGCKAIFELVFDTTDANGEMTLDLTTWFSYVTSIVPGGSDATTGYVLEIEKPPYDTALTSTNVAIGVYEAGADGAPLDALASTSMAAVITGYTIEVTGKPAIVSSWS